MAIQDALIRILNLRKEESKAVFYLMIFSFFVGLSMSFYFAASNAIFLKHFQPWMISISYMASGVIVWMAWFFLSRLDKRLTLSSQLIVKFLFVFITVLAISIGVWMLNSPWIVFVMFTWVRILTFVTLVTFWGLAGKLFNIRQGKRIFSLLGTGEVISIIIGYFSIPVLLKFIKTADLLFFSSATLLICFFMVLVILRKFKVELSASPAPSATSQATAQSEFSYWTLMRKPYFRLISLMALLPIFGYLFIDFLFLSQTKAEFANNPETIAGFFGIFLGFVAIIELFFKLISGRILNKYGLKPSLMSLPVILTVSIFIAAISGSIYGTTGLFFAFIAMARLFDRAVRSAMYEPSFQLLYQPVPAEQRMIFQNQIEGIPKAFGTVITGAVILVLTTLHSLNLVHYNWLFLLILAAWVFYTMRMYDSYRTMIKSKLFELKSAKEMPESADLPVLAKNTHEEEGLNDSELSFENMTLLLKSELPEDRIKAARLLSKSGRYQTFRLLQSLMKDDHADVKREAILACGRLKRMELNSYLLDQLNDEKFADTAAEAIIPIGETIIPDLERMFDKSASSLILQQRILKVIQQIQGNRSTRFLRDHLAYSQKDIAREVAKLLSERNYVATASESVKLKLQIEETAEYILWLFASMNDLGSGLKTTQLQLALMDELEYMKDHFFTLLSLLYDAKTIYHIKEHIESKDITAKVYALEIGDMIIAEDIKALFFPIFEDMLIQERLNRFADRFPQEKLNPTERIIDIINKEFNHLNASTKRLSLQLLAEMEQNPEVNAVLAANMLHPVPDLRKAAAESLIKLDINYFNQAISTLAAAEHSLTQELKSYAFTSNHSKNYSL